MKMARGEAKCKQSTTWLSLEEALPEELGYFNDESWAHKCLDAKSSANDTYIRGGACLNNVQIGLLSSLCWWHAGQVCIEPKGRFARRIQLPNSDIRKR